MKRHVLEKQLDAAKSKLDARVSTLKGGGVAEDAVCCDPVWRNLDAARRKVVTRLSAVGKIEQREADALARKENPEGDASDE
jgi:hypothetical protein